MSSISINNSHVARAAGGSGSGGGSGNGDRGVQ